MLRVLCAPWCQAPQKKKAKVKGGGGEDGEADGGSGLDSDEEDVGATGQLFVRNLPCVWCGCGCGLDAGQLPMACRRLCFSGASCCVCVPCAVDRFVSCSGLRRYTASEEELRAVFSKFGTLSRVHLAVDEAKKRTFLFASSTDTFW